MKTKVILGAGMVFGRTNAAAVVLKTIFTKELRTEDVNTFQNFLIMPPRLFDEILERITPLILSALTFCTLVTS